MARKRVDALVGLLAAESAGGLGMLSRGRGISQRQQQRLVAVAVGCERTAEMISVRGGYPGYAHGATAADRLAVLWMISDTWSQSEAEMALRAAAGQLRAAAGGRTVSSEQLIALHDVFADLAH